MSGSEDWEGVVTDGEVTNLIAFIALLASVLAGVATGMQLLQRRQDRRARKSQTHTNSSYTRGLMLHASYSSSNDSSDGAREQFSMDGLAQDMGSPLRAANVYSDSSLYSSSDSHYESLHHSSQLPLVFS